MKKSVVGGPGSTSTPLNLPTDPALIDFPRILPEGDEPWVDAITGTVLELDSQDLRALEDTQKPLYNAQLRYQQKQQLASTEEILTKIGRIWSAENGLKLELDPESELAVGEESVRVGVLDSSGVSAPLATSFSPDTAPTGGGVVSDEAIGGSASDTGGVTGGAAEAIGDVTASDLLSAYDQEQEARAAALKETTAALNASKAQQKRLDKAVLYYTYVNDILPLLKATFTVPTAPMEEGGGGEGGEGGGGASSNGKVEDAGSAEKSIQAESSSSSSSSSRRGSDSGIGIGGSAPIDFGLFDICVDVQTPEDAVFQTVTQY